MKTFLEQYKKVEFAGRVLLNDAAKAQLDERAYNRSDLTEFHLAGMDDEGVIFMGEYNDSCGCHPEFQNAYVTIPWADIELQLAPSPSDVQSQIAWADYSTQQR